MKKISLIIIGMVILSLSIAFLTKTYATNSAGTITIIVVDEEAVEVINEKVSFRKNESLLDVIERKYNVISEESEYGTFVLGIDSAIAVSDVSYLAFFINGEYAMSGVTTAVFLDGDIIRFEITEITPWE